MMSGAEAIAVVGLISACIDITKTIIDIGRTVKDAQGLPPKFREAFQQLPAIEDLLKTAQKSNNDHGKTMTEEASNIAEPILKQCEQALGKVRDILKKACPKDEDNRSRRVWKGTKAVFFGGGSQLQKHLKTIQDNLRLLEQKEILTIGDKLDKLQQVTEAAHNCPPPSRPETPPGPSSNIPYQRDPNFIDRKALTDQIRDRCSVPAARIALWGLGGVGKTQIAIEYCYRLREQSQNTWVLWIFAGNAARYEQSVRDIADLVKISGREDPKANIFRLLRDWLRDESKGSWVLILDNADDASFLIKRDHTSSCLLEYLPICDHGVILITTRSKNEALKLVHRANLIEVKLMDQVHSKELLKIKLDLQANEADMVALVAALEHMPLAITQAAAYINRMNGRCSVQQYLKKMQRSNQRGPSVLENEEEDIQRDSDIKNAIMLTWKISFEHIRSIRPTAAKLLSLMSWCDRQAIPSSLLRVQEGDELGYISTKQNIRRPDEVSGSDLDYEDNVDSSDSSGDEGSEDFLDDGFDDDIAMLEAYSFVATTVNASTFGMHRLVQQATQRWLELEGQQERWKERLVHNLSMVFPFGEYESRSISQSLYPQAKAVMSLKLNGRDALLKQASVIYCAAYFAFERGAFADAEGMFKRCLNLQIRYLGEINGSTLNSMSGLATIYWEQGRWDEAEELGAKVVETSKRVRGEEHPDTLISTANLAVTYWSQGRRDEAEELGAKVVEISKKVLGEEHPDTLSAISNLASTYSEQGRWDEAEALELEVAEKSKEILGEEHPDTLHRIANLASTYWEQGRWNEAEELQVKVLEISKRILGEEHPDTLHRIADLASTYWEQGRWNEAEELEVKVLEISKRILGEEHPDTLSRIADLASTYSQQGRWEEAEELQVKVLEISKSLLGKEHPDTLIGIANLASTYSGQGRWDEAEALDLKAVEISKRVLGEEHPDTLTRIANLASTYWEQGRWDEAEELGVKTVEISKRVLGEEHPDTLSRMSNLAITYKEQSRLEEAEKLALKALEGQKRVIGEAHPHTLESNACLAGIYRSQERSDEAEALDGTRQA